VTDSTHYIKHYAQLGGLTVIRVQLEPDLDGGDPYPVLLMGRDDGNGGVVENTLVWVVIQCDPEGSGAGFAAIHKIGTEQ
jgi:hypothetical protein